MSLDHAIAAEADQLARCMGDEGCRNDHLDLINDYRRAQVILADPNATTQDRTWADAKAYTAQSAYGTGETP